jgi:2,4-dienoyl-CoA reductase-like NADH-dependent reductase (Old Yellow Enzyme family)
VAPTLFSALDVGPLRLRNRVVSTSHQTSLVHDHLPTDELLAYHEARARGGVGTIFLEATAVHSSGLLTPHTVGGFEPEIVPAYRRLAERLHPHDTKLMVQLFHGGREQISSAPRAPAVAPSAIPSLRFKSEPRALTVSEIEELIDGYGAAARLAADGGVDGLELSMSHGYLPAQFLSPLSNRRGDGFDGSLQARMRFSVEVLQAVRAAAGPSLAIGARLSADELIPGGLGTEACAEIAGRLHAAGLVDFVSLVLGHSAHPAASTWIAPPPPAPGCAIAPAAAAIRAAVPELTLLATTRVVTLAAAQRLIDDGTADLVGMTRALIADPQLVAKSTAGRQMEVIECVGCNQSCIGHYHAGVPIGCAVNARTGRELTLTAPRSAAREVLVIGAGPAGAAAAIEAASAGAQVALVESADAELAERFELVVLATGARPFAPATELTGASPVQAWEAIRAPEAVPGPALVADWGGGWEGLDAAERLAGAGIAVRLACAATVPGETLHQYQRNLYLARLDDLGVEILHHHELAGGPALRHVFSGRASALGPAATIVLAQGRQPVDELWSELQSHPGAVRAGDVLGPRTLEEAVLEGTLAVRPR